MARKKEQNNKKNEKQKKIKLYLIIALPVFLIVAILLVQNFNSDDEKVLEYSDLLREITSGNIEKVELTTGSSSVSVSFKNSEDEKTTLVPSMTNFMDVLQVEILDGNDIEILQEPKSMVSQLPTTMLSLLPTAIMVVLLVVIIKMQGLGEKGKVYEDQSKDGKIKFKDVAGLDEEKGELEEIVEFLKTPEKFTKMGAKIPKGVLLCGKPGTGKTLIAKAIAGEAEAPFISMSGSEFIEMFAGLGASRVRKLFDKARKMSPCIVFIDEIDAIGARRTSNSGSETENNQTLNQLLVEMDGFNSNETIIVIAATNRPEMLDQALLRPGRFDRQITVPAPDLAGRIEILEIHGKNKKMAEDVDFKMIAEDTAGFTGAELANILNEAAIIATKQEHEAICKDDVEEAVKKVTVGLEKKKRKVSIEDKTLTAYHEAGHALVSKFLPTQNDVKEVSIVPRGLAGGYTMYKSDEDKYYISKTEMKEKLVALVAGRAAEKLVLNDISTGASNDIEVATRIAKDMVTKYGMSDELGPIDFQVKDQYEMAFFGENIGDKIGNEVKALIDEANEIAVQILKEKRGMLDLIAEELIAKEKITEEEFKKLFEEA